MEKRKRPVKTEGPTEKFKTGCGNVYVTTNTDEAGLFEVFAHLGKAGSCSICQLEGLTRSISIGLRYGIPVEEYIKALSNISCPSPCWDDGVRITSCLDAIAKALEKYRDGGNSEASSTNQS